MPPKDAIGIDGCRGGWIAVTIGRDGKRGFQILREIKELAAFSEIAAMIDIPIGLPDRDYRACDLAAREKLGIARTRVFLGARRPLLKYLDPADFPAANEWAKASGQPGISIQCFSILRKIAQVDEFISPERQKALLRETHPELIFQRLNGGAALPGKKTPAGREARQPILARDGFGELPAWLADLPRARAAPDDLLDACACAIAARDAIAGCGTRLDCREEVDARGLRMEMWY